MSNDDLKEKISNSDSHYDYENLQLTALSSFYSSMINVANFTLLGTFALFDKFQSGSNIRVLILSWFFLFSSLGFLLYVKDMNVKLIQNAYKIRNVYHSKAQEDYEKKYNEHQAKESKNHILERVALNLLLAGILSFLIYATLGLIIKK